MKDINATENNLASKFQRFNDKTLENLINQISKIYSSNNLLVLDAVLSPLINSLTNFTKLKELGKFQNIVWLDNELVSIGSSVLAKYASLIVVVPTSSLENINILNKLIHSQPDLHSLKLNIIVKDLNMSFMYQINKVFNGIVNFESILSPEKYQKPISVTSRIKIYNWKTSPIYTDEILVTEINKFNGIDDYFSKPLKQVNQLSEALMQLLFMGIQNGKHDHLFKLRNIYGKGNHSKLLIDQLQNSKIPEFMNENMTTLEIDFYSDVLHSNTDLVVLERNLDFTSCIFNQLNYHGIIDDMFSIKFENIEQLLSNEISKSLANDKLYSQDLKHLNFS